MRKRDIFLSNGLEFLLAVLALAFAIGVTDTWWTFFIVSFISFLVADAVCGIFIGVILAVQGKRRYDRERRP